jgi:hypothetical protein
MSPEEEAVWEANAKIRAYNGGPDPTYPILFCCPWAGGCGEVYPDMEAAPEKCVCGASKGAFPYVEYTVFTDSQVVLKKPPAITSPCSSR